LLFSGVGSNKKRHSSSQELSEKAKWKRAKLDPTQLKTVTEIQAKLMQHDSNERGKLIMTVTNGVSYQYSENFLYTFS